MYPRERGEGVDECSFFSPSEASCSPQDLTGGVPWSRRRVAPISIASGENVAFGSRGRRERKKSHNSMLIYAFVT